MVQQYSFNTPQRQGFSSVTGSPNAPVQQVEVPRKVPDAPQLETHITFVNAKKDGKLWIKHETRIIDWKPFKYYETAVARAFAENAKR